MDDATLPRLNALRPALKARWAALLRENSSARRTAVGLVIPEMLVFMLDETLNRLEGEIPASLSTDRRRASLAPFGPMRTRCSCGLRLLLTYYLAGAKALREILPADLGALRVKILHRFNRIAHDEMDALCGVCGHRGGPMCGLRSNLYSGSVEDEIRLHRAFAP